jgi:hypothetical protein
VLFCNNSNTVVAIRLDSAICDVSSATCCRMRCMVVETFVVETAITPITVYAPWSTSRSVQVAGDELAQRHLYVCCGSNTASRLTHSFELRKHTSVTTDAHSSMSSNSQLCVS